MPYLPGSVTDHGCTSIHFGENQLSPGSIGISPLSTGHPPVLQHRWVRASTRSYPRFTLPMDSSPGFGSAPGNEHALFRLAFAPAPRLLPPLNLSGRLVGARAAETNSPDHSTKGTPSGLPPGRPKGEHSLRLLVGAGVQGLFHPPLGVLFTFPSRYSCTIGGQVVFSLGGWSPRLPTGFRVSRGTQGPQSQRARPSPTGLSPAPARRSRPLRLSTRVGPVNDPGPTTPGAANRPRGLGSSRFARHYSGNLTLISLPRGTEMFQFPRFPAGIAYAFSAG